MTITRGYLPGTWLMLGTVVIQEMMAGFSFESFICLCGEGCMKIAHTLVNEKARYIFLFLIPYKAKKC